MAYQRQPSSRHWAGYKGNLRPDRLNHAIPVFSKIEEGRLSAPENAQF